MQFGYFAYFCNAFMQENFEKGFLSEMVYYYHVKQIIQRKRLYANKNVYPI